MVGLGGKGRHKGGGPGGGADGQGYPPGPGGPGDFISGPLMRPSSVGDFNEVNLRFVYLFHASAP